MIEANVKSSSGNIHTHIPFQWKLPQKQHLLSLPPSSEHGGRGNLYTAAILNAFN
jgi:hypothetical protein